MLDVRRQISDASGETPGENRGRQAPGNFGLKVASRQAFVPTNLGTSLAKMGRNDARTAQP